MRSKYKDREERSVCGFFFGKKNCYETCKN